jgi:amidohydrolase
VTRKADGSASRRALENRLAGLRDRIVDISHDLYEHPEIAWKEHRSASVLADELELHGFAVEREYLGLETAFDARAGDGDLTLAVCAEYDALPGLGHACGHNIIAASAIGTAALLAPYLDDLGVALRVIGTPAEEGKGGKIEMLRRGGFERVHGAMMVHPGPVASHACHSLAVAHVEIGYRGLAAHSAGFPERGINAADAFVVAQGAIGLLRQHLPAGVLVHGIVIEGGQAPNAVPERTRGTWYVRAESMRELDAALPRIVRCFEAGALATGAELTVRPESEPYAEFRNSELLLDHYRANVSTTSTQAAPPLGSHGGMARSSTDMGNVSWAVPAIHPYIAVGGTAVNHQAEFARQCVTDTADQALIQACMAMAGTIVDLALDDSSRAGLRQEAALLGAHTETTCREPIPISRTAQHREEGQ